MAEPDAEGRKLYRACVALPWAAWGDTLELTDDEAADLAPYIEPLS